MSIEIALGIVTIFLLILNALHGSKINKLKRELESYNKRLENKVNDWKHEHLEKTVDRLHKKYEALYKEVGELELKAIKNVLKAKDDMQSELNVVHDQLHALASELGYDISKTPAKYKVTKKDL